MRKLKLICGLGLVCLGLCDTRSEGKEAGSMLPTSDRVRTAESWSGLIQPGSLPEFLTQTPRPRLSREISTGSFCSLIQDQVQQEGSAGQSAADPVQDQEQEQNQEQNQEQEKSQEQSENKGESEAPEQTERARRGQNRDRARRSRDPSRESSKRSTEMESLFRPLVASAEASTVQVLSSDRLIALGTVVDRNGLILTKASELRTELVCQLPDGRQVPAEVFGVDENTDLAILKVAADNLLPVQWGMGELPMSGQWVVAPTLDDQYQIQVGVVAVDARKIPPSSPYLGIGPPTSQESGVGAKIDSVQANTPAEDANLMVGDIIIKIDEVEIKDWNDLRRTLGQYDPKDEITLTVRRGEEELKIEVVLGDREKLEGQTMNVPGLDRSNMQNRMGSRPSQRRKDFPLAIQTDLMLDRATCGGPLVNLDGQVIGINIARAGRVDSLALPISVVLPVVERLKTGEFAPEIVNRARLEKITSEFEELISRAAELPSKKSKLENRAAIEKARQEEIEKSKLEMAKAMEELERTKAELAKSMEQIENRLKVIEEKSANFDKEIKSITNELNQIERRQQSLEREREKLKLGIN